MELHFSSQSEAETGEIAKKITEVCKNRKIFAIFGELGAGKTTLVRAICKALGVTDAVKSPTFALVNEYQGPGVQVYHFDFYRITHLSEAFDLGLEEYLESDAWCFIEWPEQIATLIPADAVRVSLTATGPHSRQMTLTFDEAAERKL